MGEFLERLLGYAHDLLLINVFIFTGIVGQARTIGDMPRSYGSLPLHVCDQYLMFCLARFAYHLSLDT